MERASSLLLGTLDSWDASFSELEGSLEVTSLRLAHIVEGVMVGLRLAHIASSVNFTLFNSTFFSSTQLNSMPWDSTHLISTCHKSNSTNATQLSPSQ